MVYWMVYQDDLTWEPGFEGCPHIECPFWTEDNIVSNCLFEGNEDLWDDAVCSQEAG